MLIHEFGIIEKQEDVCFSYDKDSYECISVNDDSLLSVTKKLSYMNTYRNKLSNIELGLSYYGITVIPVESLDYFLEVILNKKMLENFDGLVSLIEKAISQKRMIIHFGI